MAGFFKFRGVVFVALALLTTATSAQAQEIATSFDQLRVLVKPGDTVTVTDSSGHENKGQVLAVSATSLEVTVDGARRSWAESQVRMVSEQRHASLGTGAKWGFFIGAGLGALAGVAAAAEGYSGGESVSFAFFAAGIYGGIGAGIGVGVSALIRRSEAVYVGRPSSVALTVSPVLGHRKGVAVSVGF